MSMFLHPATLLTKQDRALDNQDRVSRLRWIGCGPEGTSLTRSFHNEWEFWLYNIVFGLGQAPYYAYSQTMMVS